jgi:cytoskeleton protein RodZ
VAEKPVADAWTQPQARVGEAAEDEAGADTSLDESAMEPLDEPPEETEVIVEEEGAAANAPTGGLPAATPASPSRSQHEADVAQVVEKLDVVISFTGPTSVDIRDSTMNYGLIGEMDQGDQHLLGGKPPYSLIIGNAAATRIQVGGQPFDFQSVVRGNVARFILDPAPKR